MSLFKRNKKQSERVTEHAKALAALEEAARNDAEWRVRVAQQATCIRRYQCSSCAAKYCPTRRG